MSTYFPEYEYECNCGCGTKNMSTAFLIKLDEARELAGIPFPLSSGCRCPAHNEVEGGKPSSSHVSTPDRSACAADIVVTSSRARHEILSALIITGFTRIGIGSTFIHVDDDQSKPPNVTWVY